MFHTVIELLKWLLFDIIIYKHYLTIKLRQFVHLFDSLRFCCRTVDDTTAVCLHNKLKQTINDEITKCDKNRTQYNRINVCILILWMISVVMHKQRMANGKICDRKYSVSLFILVMHSYPFEHFFFGGLLNVSYDWELRLFKCSRPNVFEIVIYRIHSVFEMSYVFYLICIAEFKLPRTEPNSHAKLWNWKSHGNFISQIFRFRFQTHYTIPISYLQIAILNLLKLQSRFRHGGCLRDEENNFPLPWGHEEDGQLRTDLISSKTFYDFLKSEILWCSSPKVHLKSRHICGQSFIWSKHNYILYWPINQWKLHSRLIEVSERKWILLYHFACCMRKLFAKRRKKVRNTNSWPCG